MWPASTSHPARASRVRGASYRHSDPPALTPCHRDVGERIKFALDQVDTIYPGMRNHFEGGVTKCWNDECGDRMAREVNDRYEENRSASRCTRPPPTPLVAAVVESALSPKVERRRRLGSDQNIDPTMAVSVTGRNIRTVAPAAFRSTKSFNVTVARRKWGACARTPGGESSMAIVPATARHVSGANELDVTGIETTSEQKSNSCRAAP